MNKESTQSDQTITKHSTHIKSLVTIGGLAFLALVLVFMVVTKAPAPVETEVVPDTALSGLTPEQEIQLQEDITPLIQAGDMSACENVQNDMYKRVCINNIALNKAYEAKDISYCQYLDNEMIPRTNCERDIIFQKSVETEDVTICAETTNEVLRKECEEVFFTGLAIKKQNPDACSSAIDPVRCEDSYWLQQFMLNPTLIKCSVFSASDTVSDCEALKVLASSNFSNQDSNMKACQTQKTESFSMICTQLLNRNSGVNF